MRAIALIITARIPVRGRAFTERNLVSTSGHERVHRHTSKPTLASLLVLIGGGTLCLAACGGSGVPVASTPIPTIAGTTGAFDDIEIDQKGHRLFVADRSDQGVDVFDISSAHPKYLQTIPMPSDPNGMAIAADLARLFVATGAGSVEVVDINTSSPRLDDVIAEVKTGVTEADLLEYAAARQRVYVSSGPNGTITSIDPSTGEVKAHFNIGHTLEQPRFNARDGMVYVTSPDADALFRINPGDGSVTSIALGGCQPTGLAINPSSNTALIACQAFVMTWSLSAGKLDTFAQVAGGDIVSYDATVDRFLVASPLANGTSAIGIFGENPTAFITSVVTDARGKSAAYDETNQVVYSTDGRPKKAGITSFHLPAAPPAWLSLLTAIGPYAAGLAVLGLLIFLVGRNADPARREAPAPKPARAGPTSAQTSEGSDP